MHNNHISKLDPPLVCNRIIQLLFKLTSYCLLQNVDVLKKICIDIFVVMILENVEDEY
jgi:hypothetical protein